MELSYRRKSIKVLCYALIIAFIAIIQNVEGLSVEIGSARCFPLLTAAIILGIGEDERLAGLLGLFGGILWDLTTTVHLGFNAVFMCITCFCSAALVTYIIRDTFITCMVFSVLTVFLYVFLYWLFFIIIKGVHGAELSLFSFYIPSAFYTSLTAPIIWLCAKPVKQKLNAPVKIFD